MKNFEKVEAYFNNELNDSEKNDFLREVESNAELKSEYNFQNEVINGIKEARKVELKAMLNNVPIADVSTASSGLYKLLVGGAATLIIGTSMWYYFNSFSQSEITNKNTIVEIAPIKKAETKIENKEQVAKESDPVESTKEATSTTIKEEVKNDSPKVITPNVPSSDNEFADQSLPEENLEIPKDISKVDINLSSKVDVEIKLNKKYNFHYQYLQGKLVLYGNFEEGLFEVLELNKENTIEIYLYFKSHYYYIKDKSGDIIPLKEINNKSLKLKLERIR